MDLVYKISLTLAVMGVLILIVVKFIPMSRTTFALFTVGGGCIVISACMLIFKLLITVWI